MNRQSDSKNPTRRRRRRRVTAAALAAFMAAGLLFPPRALSDNGPDLTELSMEELMNIEVTLASKTEQKFFDVAAAVFVITREDIRRSGATTIPDLLRMAPGVQVARIDANKWAITSRGFNDRFANKLLVLVDGRSVYTPLFSGVFWNMQDLLLEDVDRIEVIRGPGAALWGANAVNGVINIITKSAAGTHGGLATAGLGAAEKGFAALRYGDRLSDNAHYRIYAKYFEREGGPDALDGGEGHDDWRVRRAGFRMDAAPSEQNAFTLQGDAFDGDAGERITVWSLTPPHEETIDSDYRIGGGHLLGRWAHRFSGGGKTTLQAYFDRTEHTTETLDDDRNTFDLDFQHQLTWGRRQEIVWGLGYRHIADRIDNSFTSALIPDGREDHLFSAFFQDEISLAEDRLRLILGARFEHNEHTGWEAQPNVRLLWTPQARYTLWAAASRAVRTPSRAENDLYVVGAVLPTTPAVVLAGEGNDDFASEDLLAYEAGCRLRPWDPLFLDIAIFYNEYDHLGSLEPQSPELIIDGVPYVLYAYTADNRTDGAAYGLELAMDWDVSARLHVKAAYAYFNIDLNFAPGSNEMLWSDAEDVSPRHQLSLRTSLDISDDVELDVWLRRVDDLEGVGVDGYTEMDVRLGWRPRPDMEFCLAGRNLLHDHHQEFGTPLYIITAPTEVERSMYAKATLYF